MFLLDVLTHRRTRLVAYCILQVQGALQKGLEKGKCTGCSHAAPDKHCSLCKVKYCSKTCQTQDWQLHKKLCEAHKVYDALCVPLLNSIQAKMTQDIIQGRLVTGPQGLPNFAIRVPNLAVTADVARQIASRAQQ